LYVPTVDFEGGGIYVLLIDGELVAKRVQKIPGGGLHIISDNKFAGYRDSTLIPEGDPAKGEEVQLVNKDTGRPVKIDAVGRIIWPKRNVDKMHVKQVAELVRGLMGSAPASLVGG